MAKDTFTTVPYDDSWGFDFRPISEVDEQDLKDEAAQNNLFGVFAQGPQYKIPDEVRRMVDIYRQQGLNMVDAIQAANKAAMGTLTTAQERDLADLQASRESVLGGLAEDREAMLGVQERYGRIARGQARIGGAGMLRELEAGRERTRDIYAQGAYGRAPGMDMYRQQSEQDLAAAVRGIQETAGGGAAGLGALTDVYTRQQQTTRGLQAEREGYRRDALMRLGAYESQAAGQMAQARRMASQDVISAERDYTAGLQDVYSRTGQMRAQYERATALDLANARSGYASSIAETQMRGGETLAGAYRQRAELEGAGLKEMGAARERQFLYNQYEPYVAQRDFMLSEFQRSDPFGYAMQFYGDLAGLGWSESMLGMQGRNQALSNIGRNISTAAGSFTGMGVEEGWFTSPGQDIPKYTLGEVQRNQAAERQWMQPTITF